MYKIAHLKIYRDYSHLVSGFVFDLNKAQVRYICCAKRLVVIPAPAAVKITDYKLGRDNPAPWRPAGVSKIDRDRARKWENRTK
jgi:hypothetical protein